MGRSAALRQADTHTCIFPSDLPASPCSIPDGGQELTEQPKAFGKTGRSTAGSSIHSSSTARRSSGEGAEGSSPWCLGCSRPWTRSCRLLCAPPCRREEGQDSVWEDKGGQGAPVCHC